MAEILVNPNLVSEAIEFLERKRANIAKADVRNTARHEIIADIRVLKSDLCPNCTHFHLQKRVQDFPDGTSRTAYQLECLSDQPMHEIIADATYGQLPKCPKFETPKTAK